MPTEASTFYETTRLHYPMCYLYFFKTLIIIFYSLIYTCKPFYFVFYHTTHTTTIVNRQKIEHTVQRKVLNNNL